MRTGARPMLLYQPLFNEKSVSGPSPMLWFECSLWGAHGTRPANPHWWVLEGCVSLRDRGMRWGQKSGAPRWVQQLLWRERAMWASAFGYFLPWCRKILGSRLRTWNLRNREQSRPLVFINRVPDVCCGCSGRIKSHCAHSYGKMSKYGYENPTVRKSLSPLRSLNMEENCSKFLS